MSGRAWYNEIDPYAAQWLRNLIAAGHIAHGDVDERSIADVRPGDLAGYTQCHFFAGIGGWSVALRLAGWPDSRPVFTGSCPCQPFSAAGAGKAGNDERHLWPAWFSLIAECKPGVVFGEQVEAAIGWGWLDLVFADLESQGYACGSAVLPACGVGAPHIRNRVWFVADAMQPASEWRARGVSGTQAARGCEGLENGRFAVGFANGGEAGGMADAGGAGFSERKRVGGIQRETLESSPRQAVIGGSDASFWSGLEWLPCTDGKARPVESGSFPLAHGVHARASKLRAYGNAIVPQVAAEFIAAADEAMNDP